MYHQSLDEYFQSLLEEASVSKAKIYRSHKFPCHCSYYWSLLIALICSLNKHWLSATVDWTLIRPSLCPWGTHSLVCALEYRSGGRLWGEVESWFLLCSSEAVVVVPPPPSLCPNPSIHLLLEELSLASVSAFLSHHAQYAAASPEGPGFPSMKRNLSNSDGFFPSFPYMS